MATLVSSTTHSRTSLQLTGSTLGDACLVSVSALSNLRSRKPGTMNMTGMSLMGGMRSRTYYSVLGLTHSFANESSDEDVKEKIQRCVKQEHIDPEDFKGVRRDFF